MKQLILCTAFLIAHFTGSSTLIVVGYYSKCAKIWRFYERNADNEFDPKVIIYNITGHPITVCMRVTDLSADGFDYRNLPLLTKTTGLTSDTVISPTTIPPYSYGIYSTEQLQKGKSSGFYDEFYINGEKAGIEPVRQKLLYGDAHYKYFSADALGGSPGCLVGTDHLMIAKKKTGHMTLYYNDLYPWRRNNLVHSSWKFDMELLKGIGEWTLTDPEGNEFTVDPENRKTTFSVDFDRRDSFRLEISYRLIKENDSLPQLEITRYFTNGSSGFQLPVLVKRH
jgi:hypothetical protein